MTQTQISLLLAAPLALLAACSSTPTAPAASPATATAVPAAAPATVAPSAAATAQATSGARTVAAQSLPAYLDPASRIATERSVYFDFDQFSIDPDYAALIERQGRYIGAHPGVAVRIEGNSDERGGTEYNLALGQKRAEAVLRALRIYGAKDVQMEAVSWGEVRPAATGHDETSWAQNRRADIQYPRR